MAKHTSGEKVLEAHVKRSIRMRGKDDSLLADNVLGLSVLVS